MLVIGDQLLLGLTLCACGRGKMNREGLKRWPKEPSLSSVNLQEKSITVQCSGPAHSAPLGHGTPIKGKEEESLPQTGSIH